MWKKDHHLYSDHRLPNVRSSPPLIVPFFWPHVIQTRKWHLQSTGLAKKLVQVFHNILWKNPNELFGQHNTYISK